MTRGWHRRATFVVVAAIVLALPALSPAAAPDMAPAEVCDIFPQDRGLSLAPRSDAPGPACEAQVGDCEEELQFQETCVFAVIIQMETAADAASFVPEVGSQQFEATDGIGDTGVQACLVLGCPVRFQRDRFYVDVTASELAGLEPAVALAELIDARLSDLAGQDLPTDGDPPPEADLPEGEPGPDPAAPNFVDVFVGSAGFGALLPDIVRMAGCDPNGAYAEEGIFGCRAAAGVYQTLVGVGERFDEAFPSPTTRQLEGAAAYGEAVILAGLTADDGSALFPLVRDAMPLIERLQDPFVARRFIEMLAARDIAISLYPDQ